MKSHKSHILFLIISIFVVAAGMYLLEGRSTPWEPVKTPHVQNAAIKSDTEAFSIGTLGSNVVDMLKLVRENKRSDIDIPLEMSNMYATITSYWIDGEHMDWNGDGKKDALLLRNANLQNVDASSKTAGWLIAIVDDGDGKISSDEEKRGIVIASGIMDGNFSPITNITLEKQGSGKTKISFDKADDERQKHVKRSVDDVMALDDKSDYDRDSDLVYTTLFYYDEVGVQAEETAYVKEFIRKEFEEERKKVEQSKSVTIPKVLRPLYGSMKSLNRRLMDEGLKDKYDSKDKNIFILNDIFVKAADQALTFTASDHAYRTNATADIYEQFNKIASSLKWNGENIRYGDYLTMIADEPGRKTRRWMGHMMTQHYAPLYNANGEYRKYVDRMNSIARKYGYDNYAEMRIMEKFGITLPEFKKWVESTFENTEEDASEYIGELKTILGKNNIGYWDVDFLTNSWIKMKSGSDELPTLSDEQAFQVLKSFYGDMGFDMDRTPYSKITMDAFQSDLKHDTGGTAATATPFEAYFTCDLVAEKPIQLTRFETLVHELLHDMHYQTAGEEVPGHSSYQNNMYTYVAEGLTMSTEGLPIGTPSLGKRYFGKYDGFTDAFFDAYPQVSRKKGAWEIRRLLLMALAEINLYEEDAPWNQRVAFWRDNCEEKLFVRPEGVELGHAIFRPHSFSSQYQMIYAGYPLGKATVMRIRDGIVKEGTPEELAEYGKALRRIMKLGARADQSFLMEMVAVYNN